MDTLPVRLSYCDCIYNLCVTITSWVHFQTSLLVLTIRCIYPVYKHHPTLHIKKQTPVRFFLFSISASFYGSGYASLPFHDAQSTTDLSFRFRTSRAEALLVLVAGRTDYCLVMLQAGIVKVSHISYL